MHRCLQTITKYLQLGIYRNVASGKLSLFDTINAIEKISILIKLKINQSKRDQI